MEWILPFLPWGYCTDKRGVCSLSSRFVGFVQGVLLLKVELIAVVGKGFFAGFIKSPKDSPSCPDNSSVRSRHHTPQRPTEARQTGCDKQSIVQTPSV